ncbi:MAG: hypothetical protein HKN33_04970 [Pyrinomonadaceae bacterium]|nr:hypothetical protein [Pyrinomonadaceae bacterium]
MSDLKAVEALEDNTSDEMPEDFKLESTPRESTLTAASTPKNEQKASASSKPKPTQKTSAVGRSNDFEVGDVKITDGRLETDKVTINDEGIKVKTPTPVRKPRTVRGLPITREQYEKLTPRQKRRVRDAMERERRRRMNLPPRPKPGDTKPPPPN